MMSDQMIYEMNFNSEVYRYVLAQIFLFLPLVASLILERKYEKDSSRIQ